MIVLCPITGVKVETQSFSFFVFNPHVSHRVGPFPAKNLRTSWGNICFLVSRQHEERHLAMEATNAIREQAAAATTTVEAVSAPAANSR
jgi:hypothetical protein